MATTIAKPLKQRWVTKSSGCNIYLLTKSALPSLNNGSPPALIKRTSEIKKNWIQGMVKSEKHC